MPLPPISTALIWMIGVVGATVIAKTVLKERNRVNAELERARASKRTENEPIRKLRRDPQTGVYRP